MKSQNLSSLQTKAFKIYALMLFSFVLSCGSRNASNNMSGYRPTTVSYYADKFEGRKTASGEVYSHNKMTASSKSLAIGTRVEIINPANSKKVIVRVNDKGSLKPGREFDLSKSAFKKIGDLKSDVLSVKYKILK